GLQDHRLRRDEGGDRDWRRRDGRAQAERAHAAVRQTAALLVLARPRSATHLADRRRGPLRTGPAVVRGRRMKGAQATYALDFERPLPELEQKLAELKGQAAPGAAADTAETLDGEIRRLERRCAKLQEEIFHDLSRWQVVQLSRHPNRPYMLDYVQRL